MRSRILLTVVSLSSIFILNSCSSKKKIISPNQYIYEEKHHDNKSLEIPEKKNKTIYKDYSISNSIKTVLLHKIGEQLSTPITNIYSENTLEFSFDDLEGGVKNYQYTIIHCNADWTKSDLMSTEYINGFTKEVQSNLFVHSS